MASVEWPSFNNVLEPMPDRDDDDEIVSVGEPFADVVDVKVVGPLTLFVEFDDGIKGEVRFARARLRGVFEQLRDAALFAQAGIAHGAVTWPGEIDLATDAMHDEIVAHGEWVLN